MCLFREQDTAEWDTALINEAEVLLRKASGMAGIGRYQLEAAVQSAHAARRLTRKHRLARHRIAL